MVDYRPFDSSETVSVARPGLSSLADRWTSQLLRRLDRDGEQGYELISLHRSVEPGSDLLTLTADGPKFRTRVVTMRGLWRIATAGRWKYLVETISVPVEPQVGSETSGHRRAMERLADLDADGWTVVAYEPHVGAESTAGPDDDPSDRWPDDVMIVAKRPSG